MLRLAVIFSLLATTLVAQESRRPSHCIAIADAAPGMNYVHRASFGQPLDRFDVRISYIDHSMFMIESPDGTKIVTDYRGFIGVQWLPWA
ncbi:MAG: Zn-dependent hydrolase, partial [Pseudomonadota bacterium]